LRGVDTVPAMIRMGVTQQVAEPALDVTTRRTRSTGGGPLTVDESERVERPCHRVTERPGRKGTSPSEPGERGDQVRPHRPGPPDGAPHRGEHRPARPHRQLPGGVHRTEDLLGGVALHVVEIETDVVAVADETVGAELQPDVVNLEPVAKTGLDDAATVLEFMGEFDEFGHEVGVDARHVGRHDATEEDAAISGCGIHRQVTTTERHPTGGRNGSRMMDLEFCQHHLPTVPAAAVAIPTGRSHPVAQQVTQATRRGLNVVVGRLGLTEQPGEFTRSGDEPFPHHRLEPERHGPRRQFVTERDGVEDPVGVGGVAGEAVRGDEQAAQHPVGIHLGKFLTVVVAVVGNGERIRELERFEHPVHRHRVRSTHHQPSVSVKEPLDVEVVERSGQLFNERIVEIGHVEHDARGVRIVDRPGKRRRHLVHAGVGAVLKLLGDDEATGLPHVGDALTDEQLAKHLTGLHRPVVELVLETGPRARAPRHRSVAGARLICGARVGLIIGVAHVGSLAPPPHQRPPPRWEPPERCRVRSMSADRTAPDRNLALELVRVTEAAALAASQWMGRGDKEGADGAAVDAMRLVLGTVSMDGIVVIGEGEKDEAPMLYNGERIGDGKPPEVDIAVDPVEGTTLTAKGRGNAISVIALSERGSMFDPGPCVYMEKIAVGAEARGAVDITASATDNLKAVASATGRRVRDLTAVILERDRHDDLIGEVRQAGARVRLIPDGDVAGAMSTAAPESGADILFGVGGTPEGVIAAAALKCMGGEIQARLWPRNEDERQAAIAAGYDLDRVLHTDDLIAGDNAFFAATGITDGDLLKGVTFGRNHVTTESLVMRSRSGTVRMVRGRHRLEKAPIT